MKEIIIPFLFVQFPAESFYGDWLRSVQEIIVRMWDSVDDLSRELYACMYVGKTECTYTAQIA